MGRALIRAIHLWRWKVAAMKGNEAMSLSRKVLMGFLVGILWTVVRGAVLCLAIIAVIKWMPEPYGARLAIGIGTICVICGMAWYNGTRIRRRIIR